MAVKKIMDITAVTGTYMKNGEEKKRYLNVGTLFIYDDGGVSIKLDAVPTNFDGNLKVFERKPRDAAQNQPQQSYQQQQPRHTDYQPQQMQQQGQQSVGMPQNSAPGIQVDENELPF